MTDSNEVDVDPRGTVKGASLTEVTSTSDEAQGEERYPPGDFTEEGGEDGSPALQNAAHFENETRKPESAAHLETRKPRPSVLQKTLNFQNEVRKGSVILLRSTEHQTRGLFSP